MNLGEQQARSNSMNFTLGEIPLPRYGDKSHEHPIKFIRELEQFFELRNVPLELRKSVLCHALYDDPLNWADIQNFEGDSYEEIKEQLLSQFWDESKQQGVRYEVMNGKYDASKYRSMSEYFLQISQRARYLDPQIPTSEFLSCIANHFQRDIRSALIISRPQTAKEFLQLLKDLQPQSYTRFAIRENRPEDKPDRKPPQSQFSRGRTGPQPNYLQGNVDGSTPHRPNTRFGANSTGGCQDGHSCHNQSPRNNCHNNGYDNNGHNNNDQPPPNGNHGQNRARLNQGGQNNRNNFNNGGFQNRNNNNLHRNHNNGGNQRGRFQNQGPRINCIDLTQDEDYQGNWRHNVPHWQRRRRYNNFWMPRNYFARFNPYRGNNNRFRGRNNRGNRNQEPQNNEPGQNENQPAARNNRANNNPRDNSPNREQVRDDLNENAV